MLDKLISTSIQGIIAY